MVKPLEEFGAQSSQLPFLPPNSTVVQCPSCRTRFAVDKETISGLDFPKFHCSRCDHVFSLGESPSSAHIEARETNSDSIAQESTPSITAPSSAQRDSLWRAAQEEKSLEIPNSWEGYSEGYTAKAPHESAPEENFAASDTTDQMAFRFGNNVTPPRNRRAEFPTDDDFFDSDKFELGTSIEKNSRLLAEKARDYSPTFSPSALDEAAGVSGARSAQGWKAFSYMSIPLLSFLLIIIAACYFFQDNLKAAASFTSVLFPKAPQVAPAGLQIAGSTLKKLALDTGEEVFVIAGTVQNKSDQTLTDVILEGFLFNNKNQIVSGVRANLNSTLASTRIRSLTPDMIKSLQKEAAVRSYTLKPDQELPFALAIFAQGSSAPQSYTPQFYGVRIYSAR